MLIAIKTKLNAHPKHPCQYKTRSQNTLFNPKPISMFICMQKTDKEIAS